MDFWKFKVLIEMLKAKHITRQEFIKSWENAQRAQGCVVRVNKAVDKKHSQCFNIQRHTVGKTEKD